MRKLLFVAFSGLILAGGLSGCNAATSVAAHKTSAGHTARPLDNFGEIL